MLSSHEKTWKNLNDYVKEANLKRLQTVLFQLCDSEKGKI